MGSASLKVTSGNQFSNYRYRYLTYSNQDQNFSLSSLDC